MSCTAVTALGVAAHSASQTFRRCSSATERAPSAKVRTSGAAGAAAPPSATRRPRCASESASAWPTAPRPRTLTSNRASVGFIGRDCRAPCVAPLAAPALPWSGGLGTILTS